MQRRGVLHLIRNTRLQMQRWGVLQENAALAELRPRSPSPPRGKPRGFLDHSIAASCDVRPL